MWFTLNNRTRISLLTQIGETGNAKIMNGIGQGSARIINKHRHSLFHDNIAKMNWRMDGPHDVVEKNLFTEKQNLIHCDFKVYLMICV